MKRTAYELGRYKKKVADQMKVEEKLRAHIELQNIKLNSAMQYMVYLATQTDKREYEVNYKELRDHAEKYQVSYEAIGSEGMKLSITEKAGPNTETEK